MGDQDLWWLLTGLRLQSCPSNRELANFTWNLPLALKVKKSPYTLTRVIMWLYLIFDILTNSENGGVHDKI
jgi:hypothetical protein